MSDGVEPFAAAEADASALRGFTGCETHDVALILGSGWGPAVDKLGEVRAQIDASELAGFPPPTVEGHGGQVRSTELAGKSALVFQGRVHGYEGHPTSAVVHGVRVAVLAGCSTVILTNAAGSIREEWRPGQPVLISDHINLTSRSPLTGPPAPEPYPIRFVDLTDAYSPQLRAIAHEVDPDLPEGVYAGLNGPHFETPAEIRYLRSIGADLVGMSTVLETIAARHLGAEVLGVSLSTNLAAGVSATPLDHEEVLEAGQNAAGRVGDLLAGVVSRL